MKKILLCLCIFCFAVSTSALAEEADIVRIRSHYQKIRQALPNFKRVHINVDDLSTEGGEAQAYYDTQGHIRLVTTQLFFESGKTFEEHYYADDALIFVLSTDHRYNVPIYVDQETADEFHCEAFDPKKSKILENRYYFSSGKMIRWLDGNKKAVSPEHSEFIDAEKTVVHNAQEFYSRFQRK
ncbi:hypothetical protein MASR1M90_07620 [Desulfovibrionales bacterium]